ncbi:MAG: FKBP-type peptidyl-prolyl cis-trans isomerase [Deltaproteobacteria bacterium]|nr:FKBP-type peptidyl-prolyl cis-trans isomerase [Deltaproteobacteria bacterium]
MKVSQGNFIRIDCELRVKGGDVIESSKKTGAVEYKHGSGQMLKGLESRLEGLDIGDEKEGVIPAAEAFGNEADQPKMAIPRGSFPKDASLDKGSRFEAKGPNGTPVTLEVLTVDDKEVVARVVHPLAGKDLEFKVKVLSVRPPPPPVPKAQVVEDIELVDAPESNPAPKSKPEAKADDAKKDEAKADA